MTSIWEKQGEGSQDYLSDDGWRVVREENDRIVWVVQEKSEKKCYFSRNNESFWWGYFALKEIILGKFQRMIEDE